MNRQCRTCKRANMLDMICGLDATPLDDIAEDEGDCHGYDPRLVTTEEYLAQCEYEAKAEANKKVMKELKKVRRLLKLPLVSKVMEGMLQNEIVKSNLTVDTLTYKTPEEEK